MIPEMGARILVVAAVLAAVPGYGPRYRFHKNLVYDAAHGSEGLFDEYVPPGEGHARPALVFVHGGAWQVGDKSSAKSFAPRFADHGFVVLSINYRFAPEDPWPAQLEDCQEAVRYFRENALALEIDPDRIGVFGTSAGGHLASMVALVFSTGGPK